MLTNIALVVKKKIDSLKIWLLVECVFAYLCLCICCICCICSVYIYIYLHYHHWQWPVWLAWWPLLWIQDVSSDKAATDHWCIGGAWISTALIGRYKPFHFLIGGCPGHGPLMYRRTIITESLNTAHCRTGISLFHWIPAHWQSCPSKTHRFHRKSKGEWNRRIVQIHRCQLMI